MRRNQVFPEKRQGSGKDSKKGLSESGGSKKTSFKKNFNKSGNKKLRSQEDETDHFSKNTDPQKSKSKNVEGNRGDNFFLTSNSTLKGKGAKRDHDPKNARKINTTLPQRAKKNVEDSVSQASKKPFDKKKYRLQKYSKKYRVEQWEDKRKKAVLREYYRSVKDEPKLDVSQIYKSYDSDTEVNSVDVENENNLNNDNDVEIQPPEPSTTHVKNAKRRPFKKAAEEFQKIKQTAQTKREEIQQKKAEKLEAIKKLKKEKAEKYRKLSRKTKKGQPIMKDRMEMLLEKIQKMT